MRRVGRKRRGQLNPTGLGRRLRYNMEIGGVPLSDWTRRQRPSTASFLRRSKSAIQNARNGRQHVVTFRGDKVGQGRTSQVPSSVIPFHSRFNTSSPLKSGRAEATTTAPSSPVAATHPFAAIADGPCRSVCTYPSHCWAVQGTSSAQDFADSAPYWRARSCST